MKYVLGIDVGSVSMKIAILNLKGKVVYSVYERTKGKPLDKLREIFKKVSKKYEIVGVGITGSARFFIGKIIGVDIIKNEITAHSSALSKFYPKAKTVIEIGGQDSKIILLKKGIPVDFAMNTVCAAGTGSFLDQQAGRLGIPIEDFGKLAKMSKKNLNVGGRCTVFAESDMIQKQQAGYEIKDIIKGLCNNLAKNYLNNVAKGKDLEKPYVLIGGVAANSGIVKAFERQLESKIIIPKNYNVMGAIGMAILVIDDLPFKTKFKGLNFAKLKIKKKVFSCKSCENNCDIIQIGVGKEKTHIGSKCGKFE
ncbi:2-hydroxyglutaryl-CoA dehydratase [Candidatus Pacearchaeota archaeon]|nr:2-hydroxyglutaryl-CoA dehydratase [Candidatus Pacearchaeota archaeon]